MPIGVIITLIICGTIVLITLMGLIFAAWVINKGVQISETRKG